MRIKGGLKKCFTLLVAYLLVFFLSLQVLYADEKMYSISASDLTILETNLGALENELTLQKELSNNLTSQLTEAEQKLTNANKSLTELEKSINKELTKRLWIGVGVGAGSTAIITLVVLLATGVIGGK